MKKAIFLGLFVCLICANITFAASTASVTSFTVDHATTTGTATFSFTISDTADALTDVELWRATENSTCTADLSNQAGCDWGNAVKTVPVPSANKSNWSSTITDTPASGHSYLYGLHAITADNSFGTEPSQIEVQAVAASTDTSITAFNFTTPSATGTINNTAHTVTITVPNGTNLIALTPTITLAAGATILPNSGTATNFTDPVNYIVTAQDGTTKATYAVTVTVAAPPLSSGKDITAFSIGTNTGTITGSNIAVTVPSGTNLTNLVATFTTNGASVTVGSTAQVSGTTANNFTNPVTYTVHASDATTQGYTVIVTVASLTPPPAPTPTPPPPSSSPHNITVTSSGLGTISPSGSTISVADGATQTFTFTPASNFHVGDVFVDNGRTVGVPKTYTFTNVTADHSLNVVFNPDLPSGGDGIAFTPTLIPAPPIFAPAPTPEPTPAPPPPAGQVLGSVTFNNGTLLKADGISTVYMVINGELRPFNTAAIFQARGLKFSDIQTASADQIASLSMGKPIGYADGTLVKGSSKTVYVVSGDTLLGIPSLAVFRQHGYSMRNVKKISDVDLSNYTIGGSI